MQINTLFFVRELSCLQNAHNENNHIDNANNRRRVCTIFIDTAAAAFANVKIGNNV